MMKKKVLTIIHVLLCINIAMAQQVISGLVKNKGGLPVVGATISVKGTKTQIAADSSGIFKLNTTAELPITLLISSVGYEAKEILINTISSTPLIINLVNDDQFYEVVVTTSRRRSERAQDVPIPITIVGGNQIDNAGAFNVNRVKELIPTVQLYSSNPRNTTLNIRGVGSTFGLTNDGIDPGVGFYIDGVYYARPAITTMDFIDIDQIEVLRGPQGTLFGKNTTAGAFNITTRPASFKSGANFEVSYGNLGYIQAKASITGGLSKKLAGRMSFSGTQRNGLLYNVATQKSVNDLNNLGFRGQLLYTPNEKIKVTLAGDVSSQRPDGYAQVVAGVAPTLRPAYRQFEQIIADLKYQLPSRNPFDRKIDHNTPWRSGNDLGGVTVNVDAKIGGGTLTSTTAWRYWNWDPSNDRDFTGLSVLSFSGAPSKHQQWSQEIRYAGKFSSKISGVLGVYFLGQSLKTDSVHREESGIHQWRFSQSSTSTLWATPGLLDGYGIKTRSTLNSVGAAAFGQLDWSIVDKIHLLVGLRYNYDKKEVDFNRTTYGGSATTDPALLAIKASVYSDQAFVVDAEDKNFSGMVTLAYKASKNFNAFATYSTSYKPVGVNLGGLPTASGKVLIELARIKPEFVSHIEVGVKTMPVKNATLNIVFHHTDINDFQTLVQTAEVGVNRGYLANAEKVRVMGIELDGDIKVNKQFSFYGALAYTDGKYLSFKNAPVPLEETGGTAAFKDISGGVLPGLSKWAGSIGGEISKAGKFQRQDGKYFLALESFYRSSFSSSPSPSKYLNIDGYALFNSRVGFRATEGLSAFIWARNLLNQNYFEQLLPAAGNAGHYSAVLGDQRTYGITLRYSLR